MAKMRGDNLLSTPGKGNPAWSKDPATGKGKSGNPGGLTKAFVAARRKASELLEAALCNKETGVDELVDAIVDGVRARDATCIKLACEYRWGKPVQPVEFDPASMDDKELKREVIGLAKQWEQEEQQLQ
jgi:hypothetical protein